MPNITVQITKISLNKNIRKKKLISTTIKTIKILFFRMLVRVIVLGVGYAAGCGVFLE